MTIREKLTARYPYELNSDAEQGFADAVHNNQINLAMYYMIELVANLQEEIAELKTKKQPAKKKSATKKTASSDTKE